MIPGHFFGVMAFQLRESMSQKCLGPKLPLLPHRGGTARWPLSGDGGWWRWPLMVVRYRWGGWTCMARSLACLLAAIHIASWDGDHFDSDISIIPAAPLFIFFPPSLPPPSNYSFSFYVLRFRLPPNVFYLFRLFVAKRIQSPWKNKHETTQHKKLTKINHQKKQTRNNATQKMNQNK